MFFAVVYVNLRVDVSHGHMTWQGVDLHSVNKSPNQYNTSSSNQLTHEIQVGHQNSEICEC